MVQGVAISVTQDCFDCVYDRLLAMTFSVFVITGLLHSVELDLIPSNNKKEGCHILYGIGHLHLRQKGVFDGMGNYKYFCVFLCVIFGLMILWRGGWEYTNSPLSV